MFKLNNLSLTISLIVLISLIVGWGISMVLAWVGPTAIPPLENVAAPINVSSTGQIKDGTFGARISAAYITSGHFGDYWGSTGDYYFPDDVGIGTTNPNYPLHIDRPGVGSTVYLQMTQDGTGSGVADGLLIGISSDEKVYIMNKENTDMIFRTNDQDRLTIDNSGNVSMTGSLTAAGTICDTGGINCIGSGGGLWSTGTGDNIHRELGNVGIGTTVPSQKLNVEIQTTDGVNGTVANSYPITDFINKGSGGGLRGLQIGAPTGSIDSPVYLKVSGTGSRFSIIDQNDTENFTILDNGNVGIGTTGPNQKLDVNGNINALTIGATEYCINPSGGCITTWPTGADNQTLSIVDHTITISGFDPLDPEASVTMPDNFAPDTNANTLCAGNWVFLDGEGTCRTDRTVDGCTNCLNATEIADIYVFNTSDTMSGNLTVSGTATIASTLAANNGISVDGNTVIDNGAGWHRTYGATGWYNGTYGGGWYMTDSTWIRSYGSKNVYINTYLRADGGLYVGDDEYFWRDAEDRIATTDSFYVQSASPATYLYSTNTYLGASSGDATHLRGNTIDGNGWSITGAGKLTIGTIDPIYEIDGIEYATYVSDFAGGVRMETSGVIQLNSEAKYVIDFDNLEKGGDLWLFWETSNKEMDDLVVILTPNFDGRVWYEYKREENKLIIYGNKPGKVSYRLTLPRLDDEEWGNLVVSDKE